jgi:hypothetical protein
VLNSLNRSIGMPDSYPFKLSTPVLEKLEFVHKVVRDQMGKPSLAAQAAQAAAAAAAPAVPATV